MKMADFEAFACPCQRGDVVLRKSYRKKTYGQLYYACPFSKDKRILLMTGSPVASTPPSHYAEPSRTPTYSAGPSTSSRENAECSNCIKLTYKINVLEKMLEMYKNPQNHTVDSAALLHDLYNDMENLALE